MLVQISAMPVEDEEIDVCEDHLSHEVSDSLIKYSMPTVHRPCELSCSIHSNDLRYVQMEFTFSFIIVIRLIGLTYTDTRTHKHAHETQ